MDLSPHEDFMQLALQEAQAAFDRAEVPVGAIIVNRKTGEVVARSGNFTEARFDPTAHAEMDVIRAACAALQSPRIPGHDLYVTLEPCVMCAQAASNARISRIIYGASDSKSGGVEHGAKVFTHATCHWKPEVIGGVMAESAAALLKNFFQARRK